MMQKDLQHWLKLLRKQLPDLKFQDSDRAMGHIESDSTEFGFVCPFLFSFSFFSKILLAQKKVRCYNFYNKIVSEEAKAGWEPSGLFWIFWPEQDANVFMGHV